MVQDTERIGSGEKAKDQDVIDLEKLRKSYNLLKETGIWDAIKRKVSTD